MGNWSLDGSKIAFYSVRDGNNEIYVMSGDGSNQVNRTNNTANDNAPAWSSDGTKIVFVRNRDGIEQVYVMGADGANVTILTFTSGEEKGPHWGP